MASAVSTDSSFSFLFSFIISSYIHKRLALVPDSFQYLQYLSCESWLEWEKKLLSFYGQWMANVSLVHVTCPFSSLSVVSILSSWYLNLSSLNDISGSNSQVPMPYSELLEELTDKIWNNGLVYRWTTNGLLFECYEFISACYIIRFCINSWIYVKTHTQYSWLFFTVTVSLSWPIQHRPVFHYAHLPNS